MSLALLEIERHDWASLRDITGPAEKVPAALRGLLTATTSDEAERFYWQLENRVVVQGQLFDSACAVLHVLLAALTQALPSSTRILVLELTFQIVHGQPHKAEILRGKIDLGRRCRSAAREGLWLFYSMLGTNSSEQAMEILQVIERDQERLEMYVARMYGDET